MQMQTLYTQQGKEDEENYANPDETTKFLLSEQLNEVVFFVRAALLHLPLPSQLLSLLLLWQLLRHLRSLRNA